MQDKTTSAHLNSPLPEQNPQPSTKCSEMEHHLVYSRVEGDAELGIV